MNIKDTIRLTNIATVTALLISVIMFTACDNESQDHKATETVTVVDVDYMSLVHEYESALEKTQHRVEQTQHNNDVAPVLALFDGWLKHARLTGDLDSYLRASETLEILKKRSSVRPPCIRMAQLSLATHQPGKAERQLDSCKLITPSYGMRSKIAMYQSRYSEAVELALSGLNKHLDPESLLAMSVVRMATGSPHEAMALLEAAESRYHGNSRHQRAWYKLQRGIFAMQSGQFERARALFRQSTDILPDWWLAEEHLAEVSVYLGDTQTAMQLYNKVIASTGYAEYITARADLLLDSGNSELAKSDIETARTQFDQRLEMYPEAVAGHAIDFYLVHGPVEKAIALAEADYKRRPYGKTAINLADAWMQQGRTLEAAELLQQHIDAGWKTAGIHHFLASARHKLGDDEQSRKHEKIALLLNPGITIMSGPTR